MTCLTFFIAPLCRALFSAVGRREQSEVDPRINIGALPPPYCGIDVALWGRAEAQGAGGTRLREREGRGWRDSWRLVEAVQGRPPPSLFSAGLLSHLSGLEKNTEILKVLSSIIFHVHNSAEPGLQNPGERVGVRRQSLTGSDSG
ncbi:hypothetical protein EYF80_056367 [Liparis tanakae]|uniref:Uncharacterized protein n=1 Tax=Liparis tanakae TaxID=230148 RepID=A0A4Z2EXX5_9TELE|nr:hypothetical protein EYF80_056367 [Liparis tanakae]